MSNARFLPKFRIRSGADFQRAYTRRQRAGDDLILVYGCENELPHPRLGLVVSRKVGIAVKRNRWKRLLREAFRLSREKLPDGVDLVIIPRQEAQPELAALQQSLQRLSKRVAEMLRKKKP